MQIRPLLAAVLLVLGVVGCDDPEIHDKIENIMMYGASSAELQCMIYEYSSLGSGTSPRWIQYSANKFIDGSCQVQLCVGHTGESYLGPGLNQNYCSTHFYPRSDLRSSTCQGYYQYDVSENLANTTKPFRPFVDGIYADVEDGILSVYFRDAAFSVTGNYCFGPGSACTDPELWYTYAITNSSCTGRNLSAFGVEE